jgi:hypothetical protein
MSAASGRSAIFAVSGGDASRVPQAVSAAGAIAWMSNGLFAARLLPDGRSRLLGDATLLDPRPAGLTSVSGLTVNWFDSVAGVNIPHSAPAG